LTAVAVVFFFAPNQKVRLEEGLKETIKWFKKGAKSS
jgi:hypothetical protein